LEPMRWRSCTKLSWSVPVSSSALPNKRIYGSHSCGRPCISKPRSI